MRGQEIRAERENCGWNQVQLAQLLGLSNTLVSKWEADRVEPNEQQVALLRQAFSGELGEPVRKPRKRRERRATADKTSQALITPTRRQASRSPESGGSESMSAEEIRAELKRRGWSQSVLAEQLGYKSRGSVPSWLRKKNPLAPNSEQVLRLRQIFAENPPAERADPPRRRRRSTTPSEAEGNEANATPDTWPTAILKVLSANGGKPMHYAEIAQAIIDKGYRVNVGATPANAVASNLSMLLRKTPSQISREGDGRYSLVTTTRKKKAQESIDEAKESAKAMGLIRSFGVFWQKDWVDWNPTTPKLLGVQLGQSKPVDFAEQSGVYVLYDRDRPIYVGQAGTSSLSSRLRAHTRDRLANRWDRFSWFGVHGVASDELDTAVRKIEVTASVLITTMEALMIEAMEPSQNRQGGQYNAVEFTHEEDPQFKERKRLAAIDEYQASQRRGWGLEDR